MTAGIKAKGKSGHKKNKKYRFLLYGLAAPFGPSSQEPGDGEYDPPDDPGDGEEVEEHKQQRAAFTLGAHHHRVHGGGLGGRGAGRVVAQQEAQEVHEGHEAVADGVEDDGPLRVAEALDVDEEGEEGKERGGQADDGAHADEGLGKVDVMGLEVHVGAGRGAVLGAQEGRALARFGLQLQGAPEAEVPLG